MNIWKLAIEYKKKILEVIVVALNDFEARSEVEKKYPGCFIKDISKTKKVQ